MAKWLICNSGVSQITWVQIPSLYSYSGPKGRFINSILVHGWISTGSSFGVRNVVWLCRMTRIIKTYHLHSKWSIGLSQIFFPLCFSPTASKTPLSRPFKSHFSSSGFRTHRSLVSPSKCHPWVQSPVGSKFRVGLYLHYGVGYHPSLLNNSSW